MMRGMGKTSRTKGAAGELEVVHMAVEYGIPAMRTAALQAGQSGFPDVTLVGHEHWHMEVKRDERMSVDAMVRQAIEDCSVMHDPVVAWRRNQLGINHGVGWWAAVPLPVFFELIR
jgi:Holliday junction resolvase